jgi:uncharacterized protein (DUF1800 family)
MKQACLHLFRGNSALLARLVVSGLVLPVTGFLFAAEKTEKMAAPAPPTASAKADPGVTFLTKKTQLWLGRSQVVCFSVKDTPEQDRFFGFSVDENYLHVLSPPALLPGSHIGYLRVRPLVEGKTRIGIGNASLDVQIVRDTAATTLDQTRPEIIAPENGSVVWGKFAVGVEQLNLSGNLHPILPVLRLPGGQEITAKPVPDQQAGPYLRYAFNVDAAALHPGTNDLLAVSKEGLGVETVSQPIEVFVINPDSTAVVSGDCKDQVNTRPPLSFKIPFAAPDSYKRDFKPPTLANDDKGGLGQVVVNEGENPFWCMPVTVPAKGLYAMFITARGDIGGNALPTVGVMIDVALNPVAMTRLATTEWQRLPVGTPFNMEAGKHVLSLRFRNPFQSNPLNHRCLYLAKYELLRLDQVAAPVLASNVPTMQTQETSVPMMQQAATMQAQATPAPMMQQVATMQANAKPEPTMQDVPLPGIFHVVFNDALQGQTIAGPVHIRAQSWWPNRDHTPPPTIDLLVNGKVIASQTTIRPDFRVAVNAFQPGENKIELVGSLPNGQQTRSPVESIILPKELSSGTEPYRPNYRFYPYDPAWGGSMCSRVNLSDPEGSAAFYNNGDATLTLPDTLQGPCQIAIEARSQDYQGSAVATVLVKVGNGQENKLSDVPADNKMSEKPVVSFTFAPGPKQLIIRFANDAYDKDKGDRNLFVRSVRLEPVYPPAKTDLPIAGILYPTSGTKVGWADAVVANVANRDGVAHADLLIDGQPQNFDLNPHNGFGPLLFPLLTRNLSPGPHQVQVSIQDHAGKTTQSGKVTIDVTGKDVVGDGKYARALFLLNRFGYGPEPRELAAVLTMGPHDWLAARLNETIASPLEENEQERLQSESPEVNSVASRAVKYLLTDADPVRARFLMWTENHFSTWESKDGAGEKSREHERFLEIGVAPFPDLLLASATSPAMLIYLDQRNSVARHLNENYAREIMELHTLGVDGGYTQTDVTTLADLLTGWTLADEAPLDGSGNGQLERTFRYDPFLNSGKECRVLGMEFPGVNDEERFDRVLTALNMLSAHPSCAHFISRKLLEHYVSDPAPPALVDELAQTYLETGGDLRAMLLGLIDKPEFWAAPARIASPIDFSVRLARMAGLTNPGPVMDLASHSGMGIFDRATPDGYPEADGYYTSSNALLQRWHFAQTVQNDFLNNGLIPNAWKPADKGWTPDATQRLVDLAAVRITGNILSDSSNSAALKLVAAAPENTDGRLHLLATFLCQAPETSIR